MDRSGAAPQELSAPPFVPARTVRPLPAGIPDSVPQRVRETLAAIRRSAAPAVSDGESAVVRVSIGRIEVRSTPPTAPARPPLPAPRRRTSLADYLTGKRENRP